MRRNDAKHGTPSRGTFCLHYTTINSPMRFTKFAGFDANGDIFGNNDRVASSRAIPSSAINFRSVDVRVSRKFDFQENAAFEFIAEAFNLSNNLNVRYFNTFMAPRITARGVHEYCRGYLSGNREERRGTLYRLNVARNPRRI